MAKKILVVTPRFPYPESGACEQDRAAGLRQFLRLGYEVRVIAKVFSWQDKAAIVKEWAALGVAVDLIPYRYDAGLLTLGGTFLKWWRMISEPRLLDGAALEYADPEMVRIFQERLGEFKPDYVWCEYTYLWPLYPLARERDIPIVVRSINFEAWHFLDEEGRTPLNYIKFIPKFFSEIAAFKKCDLLFSINPLESAAFRRHGAERVVELPLRSLANPRPVHVPHATDTLHVFFLGSTYNVAHNRAALLFVLDELAPLTKQRFGTEFVFHIFGGKFPADLRPRLGDVVRYEGFVPDLNAALIPMDIAVAPSLFGGGMQQKVFEPLVRGFPLITNGHGLIGYDFQDGREVCVAETATEFIEALGELRSLERRQSIGAAALRKGRSLFSPEALDRVVANELNRLYASR